MSLTGTLYSYLLQHKSLAIPGLGTIVIERSPAYKDVNSQELFPPSYYFRFDKYFDAPGKDFFTFLAQQERLADFEAIRLYNEWAQDTGSRIRSSQTAQLGEIGQLFKDALGEISFKPARPLENYYLSVASHRVERSPQEIEVPQAEPELPSETIAQEDETTDSVEPVVEYPWEEQEAPRTVKLWPAWVVLLLTLGVLSWHFYTQGFGTAALGMQHLP